MIVGVLLLFPISLIYIIVCFPFDLFPYIKRKKNYMNTLGIIPSLGYVVGIGGKIGAGKSTSTSGITTFMEDYMMGLAYERLDYIQTIMNKYNFTKLNKYLDTLFFDTKPEKLKVLASPLTDDALYIKEKNEETGQLEVYDRIYNDGIKEYTYESLLKDYMEAYMAIKRNNYVYSNINFNSIITDNKAFDLKGSDFKIKERNMSNNYRLRRYSIFFYDEATLDADKINLNWQKSGHADSGTIEHLRLFRHYFKGKAYYYTTLQNPERLVKSERELFNSIIMITGKRDIIVFKRIKHIIRLFSWVNEKLRGFKLKTMKLLHIKINRNKPSLYKSIKRLLLQWSDRLNSLDYLEYEVEIYDTAKEAENNSRNSEYTKFVLPKKWCYSPIDTYEYSYQYDAAVEKSTVSPAPKLDTKKIEDKIKLTDETLAIKVKKPNEKKETVKIPNKKRKVKLGVVTVN